MKFLFYDTETTGLLPKKKGEGFDGYPHIVQFSYIVYNDETKEIEKIYDNVIRVPDSVEISLEVSNIHHITTEISRQSNVKIINCLLAFINECKRVDLVIGHNLLFDNQVVIGELERHKKECPDEAEILSLIIKSFLDLKFYCTMQETISFCNIVQAFKKSPKTYVKYPKLIELHDKLFGKNTINIQLHNSLNDVLVCFRCFYKFKYDIDVISKFPASFCNLQKTF